jgi:hypothetical protein
MCLLAVCSHLLHTKGRLFPAKRHLLAAMERFLTFRAHLERAIR